MADSTPFNFVISLSVLEHLGRNLYRSFATVLGEAISNAWDADAHNVWIYLDPQKNGFWIKDDGTGMTALDFQNKFLKIGYSKRKAGRSKSEKLKRPFIGRKGIGKLALLSCAERISVISKVEGEDYVGGIIDNPSLDDAITEDLAPQEYPLQAFELKQFKMHTKGHSHGTIIRFEDLKEGARHTPEYLRKVVALYFRFSLLDDSFHIYLDGKQITYTDLKDLAEKTEFLWRIGRLQDPYVADLLKRFKKAPGDHTVGSVKLSKAKGFIASVHKPRDLKIMTTDERVGVDLFVNGRLRERDILKHVPTARIAESYLYGQIHFDGLDDKEDRFTSSREGIVADDPKYQDFLDRFRQALLKVVEDWDAWRIKNREEGDPENEKITKSERASLGLYNVVSREFEPPKGTKGGDKVDKWVDDLAADAKFNFESYAECFVSENLVRKYIQNKKISLTREALESANKWKERETDSLNKGNISIKVRRTGGDLSYLSMDDLANLIDRPKDKLKEASLSRDASEFKPIRDAVAHTALLTDDAKTKLTTVRQNIKGRVKKLLGDPKK
jgi:lipoate-protein ligase A